MTRAIIIGDVHGCIDELDALLTSCDLRASDEVVFVGDLVAKGPDSGATVRRVRELGARCVMGNHDLRCVRLWREREQTGRLPDRVKPHHLRVLDELDDDAMGWLGTLPYTVELPEHATLVVHAGLVAGVALSEQPEEAMISMRSILPDGSWSPRIEGGAPWAALWPGPQHVVFGHDAVRGLQRYPRATGLDTGCVYGGRLTALELPGHRLVSVPAARAWSAG